MRFVQKLNETEKHWLDSFYKTHFAEMHLKSQNGMGIHADETQFAESLKGWLEETYPTKKQTSHKGESQKSETQKKDDHKGSTIPEHEIVPEKK